LFISGLNQGDPMPKAEKPIKLIFTMV